MKLLHTSDWHLGASDGDRSLLEDQKFFIDKICSIVIDESIDAVLIAGDIYDRSVASAEAVRLFDEAMTELCLKCGTKVIMIAGNHDSAERLEVLGRLLSASGLYVEGSLKREICKVAFPDTEIYLLPWITEEKVKSIYPEEKENIGSIEDAYRVVTDRMRKSFDPSKRHIILSHAFIVNAETSLSDRSAEIGTATQISASVFEGFDYAALGHIHKPQSINGHVRYSGSPMPFSFGREEKQIKSVTVIDTSDMSIKPVPLPLLHRRTTLSGTYEELLDPQYEPEVVNGYVRLRVSDIYIGPEAFMKLRQVYPCLLEAAGKSFESEDTAIRLTPEELERIEHDPMELFRCFCREEMGIEADQHLISLFEKAVREAEK